MRALRTTAAVLLLAGAAVACSSGDEGTDGSATERAWCRGLDELWAASARLEDLDLDSPALADAMAALDDQVEALDDLPAPDVIADDWVLLRTPPTTDTTGRIGFDEEQEAAGDRVASWALEHCELSAGARAGLEG